jgi:hypothetical protein
MVAIIGKADRKPVVAVAKRHGVSQQAIYTWRKRFGGLQASDVKRLRQPEAENARLKKLAAETRSRARSDEGCRRKKLVRVPARRRQVAYGRERGLSARRACTMFCVARSALSYRGRKPAKDAPVVARTKAWSVQYRRYGYRRIRIFFGRDRHRMSPGRACRLWRAAGLQEPRKRVSAARPCPQGPSGPNQVWS